MSIVLLLLCLPILVFYPVLYPPVASFAAIFFFPKKPQGSIVALILIFSCAIVSAMVGATIEPFADTKVYIDSYQDALQELGQENFQFQEEFEPLYEVYEYLIGTLVGYNEKFFLLLTGLFFNLISTVGMLRICSRLNQLKLACIVFSVYYALATPQMGVPLFFIRSSLSLAVLLLAISFYKQRSILCYTLCFVSLGTHAASTLVFISMLSWDIWQSVTRKLEGLNYGFKRINEKYAQKFILAIPILIFVSVNVNSQFVITTLSGFVLFLNQMGGLLGGKAKFFVLLENIQTFIDFKNPVVLSQVLLSIFCFFKVREDIQLENGDYSISRRSLNYLQSLRSIGKVQLITILLTFPFDVLPYRLGLFNFFYFPLWLINIPFLEVTKKITSKQIQLMILFALLAVLSFTLYRIPKNQNAYDRGGSSVEIVTLDGRPLKYDLSQLINYFL
jgi:hypothetical protein